MTDFNIESYLEGGLSGAALESFETEMRNNPSFKKMVDNMRQIKEDLEMQSMREDVKSILQSGGGSSGNNNKLPKWLGLITLVGLVCFAGYFFTQEKEKEVIPSATPNEKQEMTPTNESLKTPINRKKEIIPNDKNKEEVKPPVSKPPKKKVSPPIANNNAPTKLAAPLHPAPNIRGQNDDNKKWKAMLDKIWYTDFPPIDARAPYSEAADLLKERNFKQAFVKLELLEMKSEISDTLRLLKGYCLLELGEGADALRYFDQIEQPAVEWEKPLDWLSALGVLTSEGISEALPSFKEMASDPKHPFQEQSKKAMEVLE